MKVMFALLLFNSSPFIFLVLDTTSQFRLNGSPLKVLQGHFLKEYAISVLPCILMAWLYMKNSKSEYECIQFSSTIFRMLYCTILWYMVLGKSRAHL